MTKSKKTATRRQAAAAEKPVQESAAAATKTAGTKTARRAASKKTKGKAPAKPSRIAADTVMPKARASQELVVFAFRLTPEERDLIHDAAGPARASRFVRAVAIAAAKRDVGALQSILLEAQKGATAS